ncbi:preprotein translocase subunit YajC [Natranaerovirga pectinivora]|uniref:Preprotein translocase subunit YajC n=1 Tax=Natranaerovirga pectinivora TaxID=682400 RepID=A0A4R3MPR5_9FIRM|nr:preprotein translocase subunit YajC [Natranaerovirga pectinivora]TCT16774.1 preprotein translocase subunit YajC [Natranaerovirga pectinivora]
MANFLTLLGAGVEAGAEAGQAGGGWLGIIVIYGGFLGLLWFIMIRPQKKRQKAVMDMQSSIKVGDSVLTTGGLFGRVVDVVNNTLIVEFGTNKSVRVPILKDAVASVREPELTIVRETEEIDK